MVRNRRNVTSTSFDTLWTRSWSHTSQKGSLFWSYVSFWSTAFHNIIYFFNITPYSKFIFITEVVDKIITTYKTPKFSSAFGCETPSFKNTLVYCVLSENCVTVVSLFLVFALTMRGRRGNRRSTVMTTLVLQIIVYYICIGNVAATVGSDILLIH